MMAWLSAALAAFIEWLKMAVLYTLGGLLIISVVFLIVMIEVERYKEERRNESA